MRAIGLIGMVAREGSEYKAMPILCVRIVTLMVYGPSPASEHRLDCFVGNVICRCFSRLVGNRRVSACCEQKPDDFNRCLTFSGGCRSAGLDHCTMQGCRAVAATSLIDVGPMLDECFNRGRASEADSMVKGGYAVLVGRVN